jgi:putative drug exporter of the RND superfamily
VSNFLYALGALAFKRRWVFIGAWVLILAVIVTILGLNPPKTSETVRVDGSPSQVVLDKLAKDFPLASGGQGSLIFSAPKGARVTDTKESIAIAKAVQKVYKNKYVISSAGSSGATQPSTPPQANGAPASGLTPLIIGQRVIPTVLVSKDGDVALFNIQLTKQVDSVPVGTVDHIVSEADSAVKAAGLKVYPSDSLVGQSTSLDASTELIGLLIAAIVLLLTLGSLLTAGLPLLMSLVGVAVGVGAAFTLSHVVTLSSISPVLALMVGLAVGIDYSLFIVNRARRLILDEGIAAREAVARAVGTAGGAVAFAGLTVLIALAALSVVGITFLTTMALVAAGTVAIAVLVANTLLPAALGLLGERIVTKRARAKQSVIRERNHVGFATRFAMGVVRRRILVVIGVVVVLGTVALPAMNLTLGLPSAGNANLDTSGRKSFDLVKEGFGPGYNGEIVAVASSASPNSRISDAQMAGLTKEISKTKDVALAIPSAISKDGKTFLVSVVPKTGPDSTTTQALVAKLRSLNDKFETNWHTSVGLTGFTAINIDLSAAIGNALLPYLGVIVILSLIIMMLIFRSLVIPLQATLGFVLSILATLGATTAVFSWGWLKAGLGFDTPGPVLNFLPIIVTGILYGLAMDYQVFLVSSMREAHIHGHPGRDGIVVGFARSSKVVVAAAVIMVSVFAGFAFQESTEVKQIGFALTIGIICDAFLVRLLLTPALLALLNKYAWSLPKWLDRILPNLDIEGESLLKRLHESDAQTSAGVDAGESAPLISSLS